MTKNTIYSTDTEHVGKHVRADGPLDSHKHTRVHDEDLIKLLVSVTHAINDTSVTSLSLSNFVLAT